jgi:hypothetical protein
MLFVSQAVAKQIDKSLTMTGVGLVITRSASKLVHSDQRRHGGNAIQNKQ